MGNDRNPDVVIIGGGVIGCAIALELARQGLRVSILDRGRIGQEASWAGAGILSPGRYGVDSPMSKLIRASIGRYPQWAGQLHEETGIDPEYTCSGRLSLLLDEQDEASACRQVAAAGGKQTEDGQAILEFLTTEEAHKVEPAVTWQLSGALLCPVTAQVRNPRLLQALKSACLKRNVTIHEGVPACGLIWEKDRVTGVRTADGNLSAQITILAAGAWSSQIDARIASAVPVYPVRGQILLFKRMPLMMTHIIEHGKCYVVPRSNGHLIVGATEEHDSGFDKHTTTEGISELQETATRLVPALASAPILRSWAGLRPGTPDQRPYIGPVPGVERLIVATGHFRTGITLAPVTAHVVARLICSGSAPYDLSACRAGRSPISEQPGQPTPAQR
jgi:glycine oxidase